jgi:formate hydrogenlyase subunit 3/multisubunit Na+/H+ antiporter MnhD subunit
MSVFGSLIALTGISIMFMYTGSLDLATLAELTTHMDSLKVVGVVSLIIIGFGVKAAIVPLHTWLPDAHSAAPSGISAMLSGIIIEAGLITMLKTLTVLPGVNSGVVLIIFGVVSMFVGNFIAIAQRDLKRMLAYSSIAQMGYILMAVGLAFAYPSVAGDYGFRGGFFHILNHAVMKGGAFLCAGAILHSIGTRDLEEMRGIGRKIPLVGVAFAFFGFALAGVPPLNGFISKFFICKAGVDAGGWGIVGTILLIVNSLLSLCYYLPAINKILFSSNISERAKEAKKIPLTISVPLIIMVVLTVLFGVYPDLGLKVVNPVVELMMASLGGI